MLMLSCNGGSFSVSGVSSSEAEQPENDIQQGDATAEQGVEKPVWINGTQLTCNWDDTNSTEEVSIRCGAFDKNNQVSTLQGISWQVKDKNTSEPISFQSTPGPTGRDADIYIAIAVEYLEKAIVILTPPEGSNLQALSSDLEKDLPGLKEQAFKDCLKESSSTVSQCLRANDLSTKGRIESIGPEGATVKIFTEDCIMTRQGQTDLSAESPEAVATLDRVKGDDTILKITFNEGNYDARVFYSETGSAPNCNEGQELGGSFSAYDGKRIIQKSMFLDMTINYHLRICYFDSVSQTSLSGCSVLSVLAQ